jgi:uncharacterized membrane protein
MSNLQRAELDRKEQEAIATMLKDYQENKLLIGSFLEASCREAFEMDDVRHVESTQTVMKTMIITLLNLKVKMMI